MKLYELTANFELVQALMEAGEDVGDTLEAIEMDLKDKAENYAKVMKNIEADIAGLKAEEKRLADRRKTMENAIGDMKKRLQQSMEATGKTKFKTQLFSFNIQNNAPSVVIDDLSAIPEGCYKIERIPDKNAIKELLKASKAVKGAHLETTQSLRIR